MSTPVLDIQHASVTLDGNPVLHDITWTIQPGQHWFVLGANGCGKSTLMNLVTCFLWPRRGGSVSVLGRRYGTCMAQDIRSKIGWVGAALHEWQRANSPVVNIVLSGFDGTFGLFREPTIDEGRKARDVLDRLRCTHLALRQYSTLSSGEKMRVLIARALIGSPRLLVLDEPCCHLDMRSREYFLDAIRELAAGPDAPTLILVTHRVDDIIPTFTHGLVLKDGRDIGQGPTAAILSEATLRAAFDVPLRLQHIHDRYWAHLAAE